MRSLVGVLAVCPLLFAPSLAAAGEVVLETTEELVLPENASETDVAAAASVDGDGASSDGTDAAAPSDDELAAAGEYQYTKGQQCKRLVRQIDHFENTVLPMAEARRDQPWAEATENHIARLEGQLARKCPQLAKERGAFAAAKQQAEELRQLMILAARGAMKYFTGGWL